VAKCQIHYKTASTFSGAASRNTLSYYGESIWLVSFQSICARSPAHWACCRRVTDAMLPRYLLTPASPAFPRYSVHSVTSSYIASKILRHLPNLLSVVLAVVEAQWRDADQRKPPIAIVSMPDTIKPTESHHETDHVLPDSFILLSRGRDVKCQHPINNESSPEGSSCPAAYCPYQTPTSYSSCLAWLSRLSESHSKQMSIQSDTSRQQAPRKTRGRSAAPSSNGTDDAKPTRTYTYTYTRKRQRRLVVKREHSLTDSRS